LAEAAKDSVVEAQPHADLRRSVFGSERLTGALLDRLTHRVHILEMNGESYRLAQSKHRSRRPRPYTSFDETTAN
jgi:IstB-like ATP binding protein